MKNEKSVVTMEENEIRETMDGRKDQRVGETPTQRSIGKKKRVIFLFFILHLKAMNVGKHKVLIKPQ